MARWLHHDLPALWLCDLQIALHSGSFPPGLKTRRAQDYQCVFSGQYTSPRLDSDASESTTEQLSR